jgi:hypothetical protein
MHDSDVQDEDRALAATAFDAEFYLARNPDVAEAGMDALEHFLSGGWRENRDPSRKFSIASYLDLNEDVARSGVNPLLHYLAFGRAENRLVRLDLGFRYDVLRNAPTLEARLETGRPHDIAGEPMEGLAAAFSLLGQSLFITVSHDAYVDSVGGVQLCLKREAAALAEGGWSHLHLYPAVPSPVSDFETLDPVMGVVIDGQVFGAVFARESMQWAGPKAFIQSMSLKMKSMAFAGDHLVVKGTIDAIDHLDDVCIFCSISQVFHDLISFFFLGKIVLFPL